MGRDGIRRRFFSITERDGEDAIVTKGRDVIDDGVGNKTYDISTGRDDGTATFRNTVKQMREERKYVCFKRGGQDVEAM